MTSGIIYMLCGNNNIPFYIGRTVGPLRWRLYEHLCEARQSVPGYKNRKIDKIKSLGFDVKCIELEKVHFDYYNNRNYLDAELAWIKKFSSEGIELTNVAGNHASKVLAQQ